MSKAHLPPVPPANQGPHGDTEPGKGDLTAEEAKKAKVERDLDQQGRQGNISQNTHNQGYTQAR